MNAKLATVSAIGLVLASAMQARAQTTPSAGEEPSYLQQHVDAPIKALELSVGTGYTQGFGMLQGGVALPDVVTPGIAVDLGVGYRIDPHWSIGLAGQYQELTAERASGARGLTAGINAAYHLSPYTRADPWVQLGTGYRLLWETHPDPAPNLLTHGFELAKLTVGMDIRVDKDVAIAPVIGADLNLPLWQNNGPQVALNDPRVSTFVFAGVQGRFDVTNAYAGEAIPVSQTQVTRATLPPPAPVTAPPPEKMRPVSPSLSISEEVLAACKMDLDNIDTAPKFNFDESALLPEDEEVLKKVAECFTTGPLKGSEMQLVGRADPRGTVEYNQALGARRANTVGSFLEQHGMDESKINETSRGELDATGTDEAAWAVDRRVDLLLRH